MSEELKERSEIEEKYKWDLSSLFVSDEAWEKAFEEIDEQIEKTAAFAGKLNNAETIRRYFDTEMAMSRKLENLQAYVSLRRSEDTRAEAAQKMFGRTYVKLVQAATAVSFAQPEILSLPDDQLKAIAEDPCLQPYAFNMQLLLKKKPHTLSAAEERIMAGFAEVFAAPSQIADNLMDADLVFEPVKDGEGSTHELNGSNFISLQMSNDRVLRENAFRSFYKTYRQHINTFAASYSGAVKASTAEASFRHYGSSREMSMAENNIPVQVYDNLINTVTKHLPDMYRYVKLRQRLLGVDELHCYDIYAPLVKGSKERYTYEQATELLLEAVRPLGDDYGAKVREGLATRWIDVYPNKGKSGGAYSSGTYDSNPFIMTNFTGTLDSVSTITHEMGHSMHTWLANTHQPPQYAGYTLFVAEVASTVNENLLIENLLAETTDPEKRLVLINQYLEGFKGTVYRQTMFAEFEKEAHAMAERGAALDQTSLCDLYYGLVQKYFGEGLQADEEIRCEWARIPHFYRPFYVYVYATGYSSAVALSEKIRHEGEEAAMRYLEFLAMGGSAYPLDELKHAGVDLLTPEPVDLALNKFASLLDEAEKLADILGK